MSKLRRSDKAWIALWTYVFTYNVLTIEDETLSRAADRYLASQRWRWVTELGLLLWYLHLSNHIPERFDPVLRLSTICHRLVKETHD